jgi:cytidine deaminase
MTRPASAGAPSLDFVRAAALTVMERAYAPYSDFRVGAVLVGADGRLFAGCNVENSAYPAGICAERSALAAAVAGGVRQFELLVIATEADEPTPPCGMCRQALVEFAPTLAIVSYTKHGGQAEWNLSTLLPHPFTPAALSHHQ